MKPYKNKIIHIVLFFACIFMCKSHVVKADTVIKGDTNTKVRSTSIKVNKTIKVSSKSNETKRPSRGGDYNSTYDLGKNLVSCAYNFLGKPYVWGAEGPYAFDCSGLTMHVYKSLGIDLPHYTVSQAELGKSVERSELLPGDLVFFNTSGYLSHVGIYVGNGDFIHASSGSHRVMVSNLTQSYYNSRYAKARRIVN